jgi:hypothetical protein
LLLNGFKKAYLGASRKLSSNINLSKMAIRKAIFASIRATLPYRQNSYYPSIGQFFLANIASQSPAPGPIGAGVRRYETP